MPEQANADAGKIQSFDPFRVKPLADQPRKRFRGIAELAASIHEVGQANPGIVTLLAGDKQFDAQLVDGERRLRACQSIQRPFRAEVRPAVDVHETFVASFAANFGKQDHDCIEIAQGLARMQAAGKTVKQLAAIAGKSECWVYQHLSLNSLHADVQAMLVAGDGGEDETQQPALALSVAYLLVPLPHDRQLALARKAAKAGMSMVAARRLVIGERRKSGEPHKKILGNNGRSVSPAPSLARPVHDLRHRIGVFLDMKASELRSLLANSERRPLRQLVESLTSAEEDLAALRGAIEKCLDGPAAGRAA